MLRASAVVAASIDSQQLIPALQQLVQQACRASQVGETVEAQTVHQPQQQHRPHDQQDHHGSQSRPCSSRQQLCAAGDSTTSSWRTQSPKPVLSSSLLQGQGMRITSSRNTFEYDTCGHAHSSLGTDSNTRPGCSGQSSSSSSSTTGSGGSSASINSASTAAAGAPPSGQQAQQSDPLSAALLALQQSSRTPQLTPKAIVRELDKHIVGQAVST